MTFAKSSKSSKQIRSNEDSEEEDKTLNDIINEKDKDEDDEDFQPDIWARINKHLVKKNKKKINGGASTSKEIKLKADSLEKYSVKADSFYYWFVTQALTKNSQ